MNRSLNHDMYGLFRLGQAKTGYLYTKSPDYSLCLTSATNKKDNLLIALCKHCNTRDTHNKPKSESVNDVLCLLLVLLGALEHFQKHGYEF